MSEQENAKQLKLDQVNIRSVGGGFLVRAEFGDDLGAIVEEKIAHNKARLKKIIKFYLDELV